MDKIKNEDTIVAIATPLGRGGVAMIRISGKLAYQIGLKLSSKKLLTPRIFYYSNFINHNQELLDKGCIVYFKTPYSFTGEDVIELHVHGSPIILDNIIAECVDLGARIARPGEFSQRAFLNNKIDLLQAEAIADLIDANSLTASRMALCSLQGSFSKSIRKINEKLIKVRLLVEVSLDFPDEEIDFLKIKELRINLKEILYEISCLYKEASYGARIREGYSVVITGAPNVGKSTLLNCLARKDIAIVTPIAGTTRDILREHINIDGLPFLFIDTAGLREDSIDPIEQEGIKRACQI